MDTHELDAIVIGAGIAGATVAAHLAEDRRVALIEAEEAAGYHSTSRSAAVWILNYGPPDGRGLRRCADPGPAPGGVPRPGGADRASAAAAGGRDRVAGSAGRGDPPHG